MTNLAFFILQILFIVVLFVFIFFVVLYIRKDIIPKGSLSVSRNNKVKKHRLKVLSGPLVGSSIPLINDDIFIGRDAKNNLAIEDDFVSGNHLRIFKGKNFDDVWFIEDLESTNGTLLNDEPLKIVKKLQTKDKVKIGLTTIRFE